MTIPSLLLHSPSTSSSEYRRRVVRCTMLLLPRCRPCSLALPVLLLPLELLANSNVVSLLLTFGSRCRSLVALLVVVLSSLLSSLLLLLFDPACSCSCRSSCTGRPVMSPPPGKKQGVRAPSRRVPEATRSNRTGFCGWSPSPLPSPLPETRSVCTSRALFTNWAIMAPMRPLAAQTPNPVDRTGVGNSSEVMVSMVFQAAAVKH
mmetsp:Transcript_3649/g.8109  ORF Transcript_3649/g.8109 Transcript_3649/m.8109 type:complete len:205 (-) Transcript_3649:1253-1867(-)